MPTLDVFGRLPLQYAGAFAADASICTFSGIAGGGVGLITQELQFQYQQQIQRIYELGTRNTYYVVGRSQGNVTVGRILGPRPVTITFYQVYGNACNAALNTLMFQVVTGCNAPTVAGAGLAFAMLGTVITTISVSVRAENMLVNENLQMMYITLLV